MADRILPLFAWADNTHPIVYGPNLLTRAEALSAGHDYYFTGKPCKHGHIAFRSVKHKGCSECARLATLRWTRENPDVWKQVKKAHYERNRVNIRLSWKEYYQRNREREIAGSTAWRKNNLERHKIYIKAYQAEWRLKNPDAFIASRSRRRAAKRNAQPPWVTMDMLTPFYKESRQMTETTGIKHAVDHIVPLQHEKVCGLHVPANLRVITAEANAQKGAKFDEQLALEYPYATY